MTVRRQNRTAWTTRSVKVPVQTVARLGVAVHWPGVKWTPGGHEKCLGLLESIERQEVAGDFAALAYNQAACVHGFLIEGRGAGVRSGANGGTEVNRLYGSVVALIGTQWSDDPRDLPRPLLEAVLAAHRAQAPRGRLLGHRDVRPNPTTCPGPALTAWLKAGARLPAAPGEPGPTPGPRVHVVADGDTLWSLAERYYRSGPSWERIAKANGVKNTSDLQVGQRLTIP